MSAVPANAIPPRFADSPNYKWFDTATVMMGMMGAVMSSTMLNVAIPNIMGTYGIGQDEVHWMSTATLAAMPVLMLMNGWFVNNFGVRATYVGACVVFCVASLVGQFIPDYYGLVVIRTIQGGCTGLLQPLTMTVIFPLFDKDERGKAMGVYGMGFVLGPAMGPTFGGLIVDYWHWQDAFGSSIPLMAVAAAMGWYLLPPRRAAVKKIQMNWVALILIATAIGTFLTAISNGSRMGYSSDEVVTLFFVSGGCLLGFLALELGGHTPLLQIRLFSVRTFAISVMVGFIFGAGMFGSMYLIPVFTQTVMGYTALKAGLLLMLSSLMMIPMFHVGGRLAQQPRSGLPIFGGMMLFCIASVFLAGTDTDSTFLIVMLWTALGRVGLTISIPALQTGALRDVPAELLPFGAGTMNFVRMTGAAVGTAVIAITLEHRFVFHWHALSATQTAGNTSTREAVDQVAMLLSEHGVDGAQQVPAAMLYLGRMVAAQANSLAFTDGFLVMAICFGITALSALALAGKPERTETNIE